MLHLMNNCIIFALTLSKAWKWFIGSVRTSQASLGWASDPKHRPRPRIHSTMSSGCSPWICKSKTLGLNSESAVFLLYTSTLTATNCISLASTCNWPQGSRIHPPTKTWLLHRPTPIASNINTRYLQQAGPCFLRVYRMSLGPVLALTVLEVNVSGWVVHGFLTQICNDLKKKKKSKKYLLFCCVVTFNTERRWKEKRKGNQIFTMWGNSFENGRNGVESNKMSTF